MNWYLQVLKNYAKFDGRARREEYWMFNLFNLIVMMLLAIFSAIFFFLPGPFSLVFSSVFSVYIIATIIPHIAVSVRRLHDIGKSGWMILIMFIPIVGGIWYFILSITEGDKGNNEYGIDPKDNLITE